ncbi:MAG: hypothetical protein HZA54_15605 [Planctomycetes bacterium]|nr:hypothetical protein [Planctomycetota bacterium]
MKHRGSALWLLAFALAAALGAEPPVDRPPAWPWQQTATAVRARERLEAARITPPLGERPLTAVLEEVAAAAGLVPEFGGEVPAETRVTPYAAAGTGETPVTEALDAACAAAGLGWRLIEDRLTVAAPDRLPPPSEAEVVRAALARLRARGHGDERDEPDGTREVTERLAGVRVDIVFEQRPLEEAVFQVRDLAGVPLTVSAAARTALGAARVTVAVRQLPALAALRELLRVTPELACEVRGGAVAIDTRAALVEEAERRRRGQVERAVRVRALLDRKITGTWMDLPAWRFAGDLAQRAGAPVIPDAEVWGGSARLYVAVHELEVRTVLDLVAEQLRARWGVIDGRIYLAER